MKNSIKTNNTIMNSRAGMVKRTIGEVLLFTTVMLLATELFGLSDELLCPAKVVTIIVAVAIGFTEIITALKEAVDE